MKQRIKFYAMCLVTLLLIVLDGALTYINTPDLKEEGNPLITVFGLGWTSLFLANLIFYVLYIVLAYFLFFKYKPPVLQVNTMKEYISQLYYNRPDKFKWFFYKWPKNWRPLVAVIAYAYIYAIPAARAVLVLEWLMITYNIKWSLYYQFCTRMPFQRVDLVLAGVLSVFLFSYWLKKEYRINQRAWKSKEENAVKLI